MQAQSCPSVLTRIDRTTWILIAAFFALGGYLLWDRGGPLLAALAAAAPWLLLIACPLIHVFMHRGHGAHAGRTEVEEAESDGGGDPGDKSSGNLSPRQEL